jgi:hypothetical protein
LEADAAVADVATSLQRLLALLLLARALTALGDFEGAAQSAAEALEIERRHEAVSPRYLRGLGAPHGISSRGARAHWRPL